ncbi:hypothetical protein FISHEDRAFT_62149 [Fistulina hepatica ATCC 64428]|nr:hypothetical protein FISHEDRAFT_62149 [Fistulina hepatica ATCC 64428]
MASRPPREYVVEAILKAKVAQKKKRNILWKYLVKWKGYNRPRDNTWEPAESFTEGASALVEEFWARIDIGDRIVTRARDWKKGQIVEADGGVFFGEAGDEDSAGDEKGDEEKKVKKAEKNTQKAGEGEGKTLVLLVNESASTSTPAKRRRKTSNIGRKPKRSRISAARKAQGKSKKEDGEEAADGRDKEGNEPSGQIEQDIGMSAPDAEIPLATASQDGIAPDTDLPPAIGDNVTSISNPPESPSHALIGTYVFHGMRKPELQIARPSGGAGCLDFTTLFSTLQTKEPLGTLVIHGSSGATTPSHDSALVALPSGGTFTATGMRDPMQDEPYLFRIVRPQVGPISFDGEEANLYGDRVFSDAAEREGVSGAVEGDDDGCFAGVAYGTIRMRPAWCAPSTGGEGDGEILYEGFISVDVKMSDRYRRGRHDDQVFRVPFWALKTSSTAAQE